MDRVVRQIAPFGLVLCGLLSPELFAGDWPQFRGPGSLGHAVGTQPLPLEIGPKSHVAWRTPLPIGHSSPVIVGDRIFVTGVRDGQLLTIGLDRATGKVLWEQAAPHEQLEEIHRIGSHAQCTPAADAERVVVFFGSCGLFCYDHAGKPLWQRRMGPFKNDFGAGSSPIIVGDKVILAQDHDTDSFVMALDKKTGDIVWNTDRTEFFRNYCTPVIWDNAGRRQIVLAGTLRVVGYDLETGREAWTVRGISRTVCMTPTVGDDGTLYVAGWSAGGDEGERIALDPYDKFAPTVDQNGDGKFVEAELPKGNVLQRFTQFDRDKDGAITKTEYEDFRGLFDQSQNVLMAIESGATGEATTSHVRWKQPKLVPFCSSPLASQGLVFTVKDGGLVQSLDGKTGKPAKQGRLEASGDYYASPVTGDGKIYLIDQQGRLTVLSAKDRWEIIHTADFGEDAYATPALLDGRLYLRTSAALYGFE
ncbi:MAG TPA: PQQ-binding-like beta-propeller repeat protein [Planctomycetaceae bacterium]|nr:PQQ-binding-like beta-propeller repeat protein [Planctomycetaceae bacterium]